MNDTNIPLQLIKILSDGDIYSLFQLGQLLGITINSINQHLKTLRKWGIEINNITGNNYQLNRPIDLLDYELIYGLVRRGNIIVKSIIPSTNQYMLEYIDQFRSGDACIAEYQTAGRGRRGRSWASPFGCNLYLSLYWYVDKWLATAMGLSVVTGVVIAETINKLIGSNIKVKWPNDLYMNKKKLAGILIDIISDNGEAAHIIIGLGLNISMSNNYASNIHQKWINLEQAGIPIARNLIAGKIILALHDELVQFEQYLLVPFIKRWLALDTLLNKKVQLKIGEYHKVGIVKGINEYGAILLEQHGTIVAYLDGEISLLLDN